ncbi:MAG: ABC transporter ATP-binding protein [Clostridium celatum]|uniref:ABC transporter ATP-binding protein n=1 Tax=Clostridium perfringens TaxID=1502 RepID=UPI00111DA911|nr:ABC transporter ATP-binding protein [Clostridium perfringens]MDU2121145.1 ABC transporter ATP-binding protein [Clostridium celatum]MBI6035795.1 ABC transporter ATP-binding protein [Clostridium perfringens]MDK0866849.1 ABC transporter ATP-binding protein [Clostridium perfringens]MDU4978197.1 ABC transporter ATP-binding protein [Clostridium celatum]TPE20188.1 ABC transporter ATP-binding protein [Clostridium perfringens]
MNVIELNHVNKKFNNKDALEDISVNIEKGKIVGLVGPNGAGKTTLIRIILGLIKPTCGEIKILGKKIYDNDTKKKIGFCIDKDGLYENLTARENLEFIARAYNVKNFNSVILELAKTLKINDDLDRIISEYSKGMKRKISIIKSLLINPEILILDEPLDGLDVESQKIVEELIKRKKNNMTIIISSHNLYQIENICDEVMILNKNLKFKGPLTELNLNEFIKLKLSFNTFDINLDFINSIKMISGVSNISINKNDVIIEYSTKKGTIENDIIRTLNEYPNMIILKVEHIYTKLEDLYFSKVREV